MNIAEYEEFASRFEKKLKNVAGIIIYPIDEGIPQDVILIPYESQEGENLETAIFQALESHGDRAIFTYFQNIRWIIPDLEQQLSEWPHINGKFVGQHYFMTPEVKLSYGMITFDQSVVELEPDEPDVHRKLCIVVGKSEFELDIVEFPLELGVPKTFKKLPL